MQPVVAAPCACQWRRSNWCDNLGPPFATCFKLAWKHGITLPFSVYVSVREVSPAA